MASMQDDLIARRKQQTGGTPGVTGTAQPAQTQAPQSPPSMLGTLQQKAASQAPAPTPQKAPQQQAPQSSAPPTMPSGQAAPATVGQAQQQSGAQQAMGIAQADAQQQAPAPASPTWQTYMQNAAPAANQMEAARDNPNYQTRTALRHAANAGYQLTPQELATLSPEMQQVYFETMNSAGYGSDAVSSGLLNAQAAQGDITAMENQLYQQEQDRWGDIQSETARRNAANSIRNSEMGSSMGRGFGGAFQVGNAMSDVLGQQAMVSAQQRHQDNLRAMKQRQIDRLFAAGENEKARELQKELAMLSYGGEPYTGGDSGGGGGISAGWDTLPDWAKGAVVGGTSFVGGIPGAAAGYFGEKTGATDYVKDKVKGWFS